MMPAAVAASVSRTAHPMPADAPVHGITQLCANPTLVSRRRQLQPRAASWLSARPWSLLMLGGVHEHFLM